jgi:hypothetical protein
VGPEILQHLVAEVDLTVFKNMYLTRNTARLVYKDQSVNIVNEVTIVCSESCRTINTREKNAELFTAKTGGTYGNDSVSKNYPNIALAAAA